MMIIGFSNLKGGVGKTTSCQNIAAALTKKGRRVAVVDMDPQSNLSAGFGLSTSPTDPQVFDLLSGAAEWDDIAVRKEGIDIVPSSLSLVMAELNDESTVNRKTALRDALAKIDPDRYDYMLIDSPPQLGIFTQNVLAACDKVIVPMDGGFYSLFGLRLLDRSMQTFRERLNPKLEIGGILMTNYNPRLYISRQIYEDVRKQFGPLLFETYIRQNISIVEASSVGMSIFEYLPRSKGAECYREVTEEFLKRFEDGYIPSPVPQDSQETRQSHKPKPQIKLASETVPEPETVPETETLPEPEPKSEPLAVPETETLPEPEPVNEPLAVPETETLPEPEPVNEPLAVPETETLPEPEPENEPLAVPEDEPASAPVPAADSKPAHPMPIVRVPGEKRLTLGAYEESIKQDILDMLPEAEKGMWMQLLGSISDISRGEVDVRSLREDFEDSDKDRYTFYMLNDEADSFWPVMYPDQIVEPLRCVIKWDEEGSAEVFM
ncbi:MAG: AAA family ATPase [Synergistaceae bacterium]|nr:AAA family ATPase [Synergistaceae bacterium]